MFGRRIVKFERTQYCFSEVLRLPLTQWLVSYFPGICGEVQGGVWEVFRLFFGQFSINFPVTRSIECDLLITDADFRLPDLRRPPGGGFLHAESEFAVKNMQFLRPGSKDRKNRNSLEIALSSFI